jgi:hypothetical protein
MRRRDVISLTVLTGLIFSAWGKLQPPRWEDGEFSLGNTIVASYDRWSGPISVAQASLASTSALSQGEVKGASTDSSPRTSTTPQSLLPVEEYAGSPFDRTLGAMLAHANVTVYPEDIVEAFPAPSLGLGSVVKVYRATPVEVTDWGKKKTYRTWQKTVDGFLAERTIELGDKDRVQPDASTALTIADGAMASTMTITRVAITEVKVKETIAFKKIEKEDPTVLKGEVKVDKGEDGERIRTFRVTREDGIEVKRELLKNEVTKPVKDETRIIGTKLLYGETYKGRSSWYKYTSTKVATDHFKRGVWLEIKNLDNGKKIIVKNDGCICADTGYVVDLHPDHFTALGGVIRDGVMKNIQIAEIVNY